MPDNLASSDAAPSGRRLLSDLPGWQSDDHAAALSAYRRSNPDPVHVSNDTARRFIEARFAYAETIPAKVTGYYEPELDGSLIRSDVYPVPVHACPDHCPDAPRANIEPLLAGHELCWLRDEVDRFFLQVQGSGRVRLAQGGTLRLGYAGSNGQPYRSIGARLIALGEMAAGDISAEKVKVWLRSDTVRGRALMGENPSYVMFERLDLPEKDGPIGALGVSVTPMRSIAVDPEHHALGGLFWLDIGGVQRLVVAQDTGSAIKGHGRVDLFHGTGEAAGRAAGRVNTTGRLTALVPR
ncbi:MAG: MltA domain-containing protein [Pseudomonadota bacterium]